jgi:hypothetical protein
MGGSTTTTTTYDYSKEGSDEPINSSEFKHPDDHQNPQMPFGSKRFAASDANWEDGSSIQARSIASAYPKP